MVRRERRFSEYPHTGALLRQHRADKPLRALSDETSIPTTTIARIEAQGIPHARLIRALAQALATTPNELLGWDDRPTLKEIWKFYKWLQGYSIERLTKDVDISLQGDARITQTVEGLQVISNDVINISHSVVAHSGLERKPKSYGIQGIEFEWLKPLKQANRQARAVVNRPKNTSDKATLKLALFPNQTYSYKFTYTITKAFEMAVEDTLAARTAGIEASSIFLARPVERLRLKLVYPDHYNPIGAGARVWKGDSLFSADLEDLTSRTMHLGEATAWFDTGYNGTRPTATLEAAYPANGCSYGILWRPVEYEMLSILNKSTTIAPSSRKRHS